MGGFLWGHSNYDSEVVTDRCGVGQLRWVRSLGVRNVDRN